MPHAVLPCAEVDVDVLHGVHAAAGVPVNPARALLLCLHGEVMSCREGTPFLLSSVSPAGRVCGLVNAAVPSVESAGRCCEAVRHMNGVS